MARYLHIKYNMKIKLSNYPSFTKKDIVTLRGYPAAKIMKGCLKPTSAPTEEWIYYHLKTNYKEHYLFKDEQLIEWKEEQI